MKLKQPLDAHLEESACVFGSRDSTEWVDEKPLREMVTSTKCIRHVNDITLDSPAQDTIPGEVNKTSQVANTRHQDWTAHNGHVLSVVSL